MMRAMLRRWWSEILYRLGLIDGNSGDWYEWRRCDRCDRRARCLPTNVYSGACSDRLSLCARCRSYGP